ncbi:unnamed protein product [Rhodiola kirilowii]
MMDETVGTLLPLEITIETIDTRKRRMKTRMKDP